MRVYIRFLISAVEGLAFFPSAGIVAYCWVFALRTGGAHWTYPLLLFLGALLLYNLDRIRTDPADALNVPERVHTTRKLKFIPALLALVSAAGLIWFLSQDLSVVRIALVLAATLLGLWYSVPLFGIRIKDLPFIKTLFPPAMVTAAAFAPRFIARQALPSPVVILFCFAYLLFNMVLCDERDIEGDRVQGVRTIPAVIGRTATTVLLVLLILLVGAAGRLSGDNVLAAVEVFCMAVVLAISRGKPSKAFYAWGVEGLLFVPLLTGLILGNLRA